MSLLTIITDPADGAATLCGLPNPTSIVGSTDPNAPLLLRLANQAGRDLARRHDWQALKIAYTVASVASETQTALPADYERMVTRAEIWNRALGLRYSGPASDRELEQVKALGITTAYPGWWQLIGGALLITPAPAAGQTLSWRYISKNWVKPVTGTSKDAFTLDTDVALIPERLITLEVVWRYRKTKGFDYAEDLATSERAFELAASNDQGQKPIVVSSRGSGGDLATPAWPGKIIVP